MLNDNNRARFSHDCDCCAFVGRVGWGDQDADVWVCLAHRELIVRFSSRADHYMARPLSMLGKVQESENIWIPASHALGAWLDSVRALEDFLMPIDAGRVGSCGACSGIGTIHNCGR